MKRLLLFLLIGFVAGIAGTMLLEYTVAYDTAFFRCCAEVSDAWAVKLRKQQRPCLVMAGGSEIRMSVDPALMFERLDVPAINAAGNAGFGLRSNIVAALPYLRSGDTLLVSCRRVSALREPSLSAGLKFCFQRQGFSLFSSGILPLTPRNLSSLFLGDVRTVVIALGRQFRPYEQRYRYHHETVVHPSGWVEVQQYRMQQARCVLKPVNSQPVVSAEGVEEFVKLRDFLRERGVELVIHIPVGFAGSHKRVIHAQSALIYTQAGIPVLRDYRLGCISDSYDFADTGDHLTELGTRQNSLTIARAFKEKSYWSEAELVRVLSSLGWRGSLPGAACTK